MKYLVIILLSFVCFNCNSDDSSPTPPFQDDNYSINILSGGHTSDIIVKPYYRDSVVVIFNYTQPDSFYQYKKLSCENNISREKSINCSLYPQHYTIKSHCDVNRKL